MALITPANFREHFPALTGTGEDSVLTTLIARADDLLAAFCGFRPYDGVIHSLTQQSYSLKYSGPSRVDPRVLCLCTRPVGSVSTVEVDATGFFGGSEEALTEGTDFVADLEEGILLRSDGERWPVAIKGISVEFTAGFATTPPGLVAIAAAEVRHLWNLRNTQGESGYTIRGDSAQLEDWDQLIPLAVQAAIAPYRVCA